MTFIILSIIAGLLGLFLLGGVVFSTERGGFLAGFVGLGVVFGVLTLIMSITTVDARSVAIQQSFGRYQDTLDPGIQLIAPWSSTEEFTTRLQPADLDTDQKVPVTFKGGGSGWIGANFQWQISDEKQGAKNLWQDYKEFKTVRDDLVMKQARDVIINVANDYEPNVARENQDKIGQAIKTELNNRLSRFGVDIQVVSVVEVPLSDKAQQALDKVLESQSNIKRAEEERTRAKIDAETAQIRERTGALSAQANQRFCLDVVNNWDVAKNGALPATFDCSLGSSGKNVLVGAGK